MAYCLICMWVASRTVYHGTRRAGPRRGAAARRRGPAAPADSRDSRMETPLQEHIASLRQYGFTVVPDVIPAAEVEGLRAEVRCQRLMRCCVCCFSQCDVLCSLVPDAGCTGLY